MAALAQDVCAKDGWPGLLTDRAPAPSGFGDIEVLSARENHSADEGEV
jgi:hypothetical protein